MAHPRKFVEKIAIHNQRMAEETRAFEEIMKEVSVLGSSIKANSNQHHRSLPNVNTIGFGQNHIDLQRALMNLDNLQRIPGRMDHSPMRERRFTAPRSTPFPTKRSQFDSSPYHTAPPYHLTPPQIDQGQNWRRAISDSSLHQSVMGGSHQMKDMDVNKMEEIKRAGSPQNRPRSCEVPGIKMFPTSEQASPISTPQLANTGSLPDLTNLHIPSPLQTPIDTEENQMNAATSPPHYPTSPRSSNVRRHSPVLEKQPYPPAMPYIDPGMSPLSPLELRLQQFQPYQQSPTSSPDITTQFASHSTTVSSPIMSPTVPPVVSPLFKNFPVQMSNDSLKQHHPMNSSLHHQIPQDSVGMGFQYGNRTFPQRLHYPSISSQQMHSQNTFGQFYSQANARVPDLIVTSEDEESQRLDLARELTSAMVNVGGGSPADFYSNDDPLKVELGQLDMESLQMLSGHGDSEVADQATEDQFRLDRMSGSTYGFP